MFVFQGMDDMVDWKIIMKSSNGQVKVWCFFQVCVVVFVVGGLICVLWVVSGWWYGKVGCVCWVQQVIVVVDVVEQVIVGQGVVQLVGEGFQLMYKGLR